MFVTAGYAGFAAIQNGPERDGAPSALRSVLDFNGRIWKSLFSDSRQDRTRGPKKGKKPRVNGDIGIEEPIDLSKWSLNVESGAKKLALSMAEIQTLPRVDTSAEFRCIEGWSEPLSYGGVRFSDFMKRYDLGIAPDGKPYKYVALETPNHVYYVSIDMDSMLHAQTLLSWEMNGEPLSSDNGAPLRLIIPIKYGIKSLKRIGRIWFSNERPPDYWAEQGYDWFAGL